MNTWWHMVVGKIAGVVLVILTALGLGSVATNLALVYQHDLAAEATSGAEQQPVATSTLAPIASSTQNTSASSSPITSIALYVRQGNSLLGTSTISHPSVPKPTSSSTTSPVKKPNPPTSTTSISVASSSTPSHVPAPPIPSASSTPVSPAPTSSSTVPEDSPVNPNDLNQVVRAATVNILCFTSAESPLSSLTGSGVMIDNRGVVLTNAHVAQYFLLKDYPMADSIDCTIRTGSPARATYNAELLYLPENWVEANASNITSSNPQGTGENDFALLRIMNRVDGKPLGSVYSLGLDTDNNAVHVGQQVFSAAYPAALLAGSEIVNNLYAVSSVDTIDQQFSFADPKNTDLISLGGSVLAQRGSSGGAVVSQTTHKLDALIVTATQGRTTGESDLRAITLSHINRSLQHSLGVSLDAFLSGDLQIKAEQFQRALEPELTQLLIQQIGR